MPRFIIAERYRPAAPDGGATGASAPVVPLTGVRSGGLFGLTSALPLFISISRLLASAIEGTFHASLIESVMASSTGSRCH
jgi:hypothetical protein